MLYRRITQDSTCKETLVALFKTESPSSGDLLKPQNDLEAFQDSSGYTFPLIDYFY